MSDGQEPQRVRLRVAGTVQGVGFRPFVYRLAHEESLGGYVLNDERGVVIEVEGPAHAVARMLKRLQDEAPPLSSIETVEQRPLVPVGERTFTIRPSMRAARADALIAPDTATCEDCLRELFDPVDRRHRYPFVNCTNCGPRLTIVRGVPYDRALTTMAAFAMCASCAAEYSDPLDRRFHAQPNACPACGPQARLIDFAGQEVMVAGARDAVDAAARRIAEGLVVAVKGLGGYHLACNAADEDAVRALRDRKHREAKPFALMVAGVEQATRLVAVGPEEAALLSSPARPIMLAARRPGAAVAQAVAPASAELGVMLAYTPLHHVLLADAGGALGAPAALVMTSANASDEPIAYDDDDAQERLAGIADLLLVHDRPIQTRVDDSIARVVRTGGVRHAQMLRRSRGYVPTPLTLPVAARRPVLACGAEQKSTFCLGRGDRAWVGHHIGDLEHYPAYAAFTEGITHFQRLFDIEPELVVCDLHPDYRSTAYAQQREGVELLAVQHHHAHLAACLAEHGRAPDDVAVGAIFDGTGYGTDATIWGGEILVGSQVTFERVASLRPVRMPGGAAAIREPWRMALAWLSQLPGGAPSLPPPGLAGAVPAERWRAVTQVHGDPGLSPVTTSVGRLFDAVAALCAIAPVATYEGQAAVELAAVAPGTRGHAYELPVVERDDDAGGVRWMIDPLALVAAVAGDVAGGVDVATISGRFHDALALATASACVLAAGAANTQTVVLSGGVFQNQRLVEDTARALEREGLEVLVAQRLPCNDGAISFGQAAIAVARDRA